MRRTISSAAILLAVSAIGASAQTIVPVQRHGEAWVVCHNEIQAFCGNIPRGGGRVFACLEANGRALSPVCQHVIASIAQRRGVRY